VVEAIQKLRWS